MKSHTKVIAAKPSKQQNTAKGKSPNSRYMGSNLAVNHKPGKPHSSLYKGSDLSKNHTKGYAHSTLYKGNTLDVTNNHSH